MSRLNQRAIAILQAELKRLIGNNPANQVLYDIASKRIEKLQMQFGQPADIDELFIQILVKRYWSPPLVPIVLHRYGALLN
jgi:hypothetical protein